MKLMVLVGNGRDIGLFSLPFFLVLIPLNILFPEFFIINGTSGFLFWLSLSILVIGIINWIWTIVLILTKIPKKKLITTGPYAIVKHPLYVGAALLVSPWLGFILNTWLGLILGIVLYIGSRIHSPKEEKLLAKIFGAEWGNYNNRVKLPWI